MPEYERHLFDNVEAYWQARRIYNNYNDSNRFFSLGENLLVDAILEDYGTFVWKEYEFRVLPAKDHTYGMVSLIADADGRKVAFTGDLMTSGGNSINFMQWSTVMVIAWHRIYNAIDPCSKKGGRRDCLSVAWDADQ
ncbi:hypothetical protein LMTR13_25800 [Bradyrhizobium icense]|uniref:Metallo-beta-lactamase domain-containing protein n=1 Tax=Bradyrhizobium icense TaxID=1274631 RepID=A0A1B1UK20_9BRAD|nr:hypothetical protein LMTR13_25800 [Bradyrhizobium icense]